MELGIDSLDFVELIFEIEEVFDIEISTELNREFNTKTAVNSSGYFKDAANMLGLRDLTIVYDTERLMTHFSITYSNTVGVRNGSAAAITDGD